MAVYGYCRVSSKGQEDNTSLLNQEAQIKEIYNDAEIIKEVFTGATGERPKFKNLLRKLKKGDILVCTKLDRFMRDTAEGIKVAGELKAKGVKLHLLDLGIIDGTYIGELIFKIMLSFAEFEKNRISERMAEGMKNAIKKNGGEVRGRKKLDPKKKNAVIELYKTGNYTYNQIIDITGVSRGKVGDYIREYKAEQQRAEEEAAAKLQSGQILEQKEIDAIIEKGQQKFCK